MNAVRAGRGLAAGRSKLPGGAIEAGPQDVDRPGPGPRWLVSATALTAPVGGTTVRSDERDFYQNGPWFLASGIGCGVSPA